MILQNDCGSYQNLIHAWTYINVILIVYPGKICLLVQIRSIFFVSAHRCVSGCLYSVLAVQTNWSLLRGSSRLVITSSISAGTGSSWSLCRPVGKWCDAALSRIVRRIFSSLWQFVGRKRLLRVSSTSCLYLSQLAFFRLT